VKPSATVMAMPNTAGRAKEQSDPLLRQDFLDCERRWLLLARGYELAERMEALSKGLPPARRVKAAA
jgi:hypothetical protein